MENVPFPKIPEKENLQALFLREKLSGKDAQSLGQPRTPNSKQSKLFLEITPQQKNTSQHNGKVISQPKSNKQSIQVEPSSSVKT